MKVPGSDGSGEAKRIQDATTGNQSVARRGVAGTQLDESSSADQANKAQTDSVQLSAVGAFLRDELDPVKMAEERRQKIAALKQKIDAGTYAPSLDAVAQSVGEELSLEILFGRANNS